MNELIRLSRITLTTEDDVREEFVTPLLRLLGYDHIRGEICRAKKLDTPYKSGTKRKEYIVPDYLVQLGGSAGIALDAKVPAATTDKARHLTLDQEYVAQVHSYAAHREVQAPYFVVTNGQSTAVFETTQTTFEPILVVAQHELESRFEELQTLLGKRKVSELLAMRLPLAWSVPLRTLDVGFQPINLDIGDIDQDGLPEVAIAISENRVPIINSRGKEIGSVQTSGWVWWVKCTGSTNPYEATLIALQHASGPLDTTGKLLGISGSRVIWEHVLPRAGSGFEELDRIVIDPEAGNLIFAVACDNIIGCLSFAGEKRWETRVGESSNWSSVMHVLRVSADTVLVTVGSQLVGMLAEIDARSGVCRAVIDLPFRGGQIESLDPNSHRVVISNVDGPEIAIIDRRSREVIPVSIPGSSINNRRLAVSTSLGLLVVTGVSCVTTYSLQDMRGQLPEPLWISNEARGYINRLAWVDTVHGPRLLLSTCGTLASPHFNEIFLFTPQGAIEHRQPITSEAVDMFGTTGIRDVKAAFFSRDNVADILAIADDSRLYLWHTT